MKILLPLFLFAVVTATKAGDIIIINDVKKDVVVNTKFLSDPTEHDGSYDERTVLKDNKELLVFFYDLKEDYSENSFLKVTIVDNGVEYSLDIPLQGFTCSSNKIFNVSELIKKRRRNAIDIQEIYNGVSHYSSVNDR